MADEITKQTLLYKTISGLLAVQSSLYSNDLAVSSALSSAFANNKITIGTATGLTSSAYSFRTTSYEFGTGSFGSDNVIPDEKDIKSFVSGYLNNVGNLILDHVHKTAYTSSAISENTKALAISSQPADVNPLSSNDDQDRTLIIGLKTDETTITQSGNQLEIVSAGIWQQISGAVENVTPKVSTYSLSSTAAQDGYAHSYLWKEVDADNNTVASTYINIPKDQFLLTSNFAWLSGSTAQGAARNVTFSPAAKPATSGYNPYLYLELATSGDAAPQSTWIPLADLVDSYDGVSGIVVKDFKISGKVKDNDPYLKVGSAGFYTEGIDTAITNGVTGVVSPVSGTLTGQIAYVSGVLKGYTSVSAVSSAISSVVSDVSTINTKLGELAGNAANITVGEVLVADASKHISGSNYTIGNETYSPVSSFGGASKLATENAVSSYVSGYVKEAIHIAQTEATDCIPQLSGQYGNVANTVPLFEDAAGNALISSGFTIGGTTSATFEGSATKLATESAVSSWVEYGLEGLYSQLTGLLVAIESGLYYPISNP